ncbi:RNA polymerase sigma factor, partial [Actinoplanes octamycinicus]
MAITRESTIDAARRGDRRARDELFRRQLPVIYSAVARLVPAERVDDVVQETAAQAVKHLDELRAPANLRSWLLTIALREARRDRAARQTEADWSASADPAGSGVDPQDLAVARVERSGERFEVAVAASWLDEDDRELLTLWWLELLGEMDRASIAAALDQSLPYVAVRLQRMRDRLAKARTLVRVLAEFRRAGSDNPCPDLAQESAGWDGKPSPLWRKRLLRHVAACPRCTSVAGTFVPAEQLLPTFVLLVPQSGLLAAPTSLSATPAKAVVRTLRRLHSAMGNTATAGLTVVAVAASSIGVYAAVRDREPVSAEQPAAIGVPAPVPSANVTSSPAVSGSVSVRPS